MKKKPQTKISKKQYSRYETSPRLRQLCLYVGDIALLGIICNFEDNCEERAKALGCDLISEAMMWSVAALNVIALSYWGSSSKEKDEMRRIQQQFRLLNDRIAMLETDILLAEGGGTLAVTPLNKSLPSNISPILTPQSQSQTSSVDQQDQKDKEEPEEFDFCDIRKLSFMDILELTRI
ncbi:hypothetical protein RFI_11789 [Reticulomyxa filosa]|uniref:Uncharacterized protein n=1 Tax=Reticulomyxa filosa TaxID=46433 RepID=X6NHA0_RETFI|nr:hypothetical protein RFI_11789 [Reticulomyxa filosa]|eukprot:ETO25351.1 hypothetical protein RFI_11789 [Reticulomyxa filosa]